MNSRAAGFTKTGIMTIAASLIGFSPAATASAEAPVEAKNLVDAVQATIVPKSVGEASTTNTVVVQAAGSITDVLEPIAVTSEEAPVDSVVRPMAEGTYRNTSAYGARWGSIHTGTDMAAALGTPIYAIADGEVVHAGGGRDGRSGQLVIIHHVIDGQDVWSWYGHMYTDGVRVAEGDTVTAGDLIANVGSNGRSTGPHLHFEIHQGDFDNHVDPLAFLANTEAPFLAA